MGGSATASLRAVPAPIADPGDVSTAQGWAKVSALTLVVVCSFVNLLIPIERGFPYVNLGGLNIALPVLLNLLAFAAIFFARPIRTLRGFAHPPLFWQAVIALFMLFRGVLSPEVSKGVATAIIYGGTWVAQFALLLTVLNWVGRTAFARAYLWVAGIAAVLGVLEGLFGIVLPPYQIFRFIYGLSKGYENVGGTGRVDGPPGNSILFAFMMVLSVPFAFEVRTRAIRWGLVALFVLAVALSIARIGYLMLLILAMGGLLMGGKRATAAAIGLAIVLTGAIVAGTVFSSHPVVRRITGRLSGEGEASENVRFRTEAIRLSVGKTVEEGRVDIGMWGAGIRSGDKIGVGLSTSVTTLDNAYATLFYEGGALLLGAYLAAHAFHLRRLWIGYGPARLYWFGAVAGLTGGIAFVSTYSAVANFPFVATLAVLGHERMVRRPKRRKAVAPQAPAPALDAPA